MRFETNYLSYIDVLAAGLGANILIMLVLSLTSSAVRDGLAPPSDDAIFIEVRSSEGSTTPLRWELDSTEGLAATPEVGGIRAGEDGILQIACEPSSSPARLLIAPRIAAGTSAQIVEQLRRPEFAALTEIAVFAPYEDEPLLARFTQALKSVTDSAAPTVDVSSDLRLLQAQLPSLRTFVQQRAEKMSPVVLRRVDRLARLAADEHNVLAPTAQVVLAEIRLRDPRTGVTKRQALPIRTDSEALILTRGRDDGEWKIGTVTRPQAP